MIFFAGLARQKSPGRVELFLRCVFCAKPSAQSLGAASGLQISGIQSNRSYAMSFLTEDRPNYYSLGVRFSRLASQGKGRYQVNP